MIRPTFLPVDGKECTLLPFDDVMDFPIRSVHAVCIRSLDLGDDY